MQIGAALGKRVWRFVEKLKEIPCDLLIPRLGIYAEKIQTLIGEENTHPLVLIAALSVTAERRQLPQTSSVVGFRPAFAALGLQAGCCCSEESPSSCRIHKASCRTGCKAEPGVKAPSVQERPRPLMVQCLVVLFQSGWFWKSSCL